MKKTLLLCALVSATLLAWCTTKNYCPEWTEYRESFYDNWNIESQWCFKNDSDIMEWHRIYYFENGWKDMEWDMANDLAQWERIIYDEDGKNIIRARWNYKDDIQDGEWKYYDDDWKYMCSDVYSEWELTDEWTCEY